MALNADAMFEFRPYDCNKGLLPTILCTVNKSITRKISEKNVALHILRMGKKMLLEMVQF